MRWDLKNGTDQACKRGDRVTQLIVEEANALKDKPGRASPERIERLFGWAIQTGNVAKVNGMLTNAAKYLTCAVDQLDSDPFLVACPNGTIRISSHCEFQPSGRKDRITRSLVVRYPKDSLN